jgi:hypothetical protein
MSSERYNQIIDEAYDSFGDKVDEMWQKSDVGDLDDFIYDKLLFSGYNEKGEWFARLITKEEFINKCKTDPDFSEKWGLKIEERELSLEERAKWLQDNKGYDLLVGNLDHDHIREVVEEESPTKLITLTYNNETIESYE